MERNMVLAVIFSAAAVVGAIETVYQVRQTAKEFGVSKSTIHIVVTK